MHKLRTLLSALIFLACLLAFKSQAAGASAVVPVFAAGESGYAYFRIPVLAGAPNGDLLAFAEGRKSSLADTGDIDVVCKRSVDQGLTWGPLNIIADFGGDSVGSPCVVVERNSGTIFLWLTSNVGSDTEQSIESGNSKDTRRVWLMSSMDSGQSWTTAKEMTAYVKDPSWTWYATGPGIGIELANGTLVVPCDHVVRTTKLKGAHVIISTDAGASWSLGGSVEPDMNESQLAQRASGELYMIMRNYRGTGVVASTCSEDGGATWTNAHDEAQLTNPVCEASLLAWTTSAADDRSRWLFCGPASTAVREQLTVKMSYDEGNSWPISYPIYKGPSAYSSLLRVSAAFVDVLFENGAQSPYERISFVQISRSDILDSRDDTGWTAPKVNNSLADAIVAVGGPVTLSVGASGVPAPSYSWRHNGLLIPGKTSSILALSAVGDTDAGNYAVDASNPAGTVTSRAELVVRPRVLGAAHLVNMSCLGPVSPEAPIIIGCNVLSANGGQLLVRLVGSGLRPFGVTDAVSQQTLNLYCGSQLLATNSSWSNATSPDEIASAATNVGAFPLAPNSADAAMLISLPPTLYTAVGASNETGDVLLEAYSTTPQINLLSNISVRGRITASSQTATVGFVVAGQGYARILVRAIGPTLAQFGLDHPVPRPVFQLFDGTHQIAAAADSQNPNTEMARLQVGAFPISATLESSLVIELPAGEYTARITDGRAIVGPFLFELYLLPSS